MALSTGVSAVDLVHCYVRGAPLHLEELRVTFAAGRSLGVVLMGEGYRHGSVRESEVCQMVAVVAGLLV